MLNYIQKIKELAKSLGEIKIMEVCGGHTHTIMKYGLRELLPPNIKLVSGPGCPVCVTSQHDIDCVVELALEGVKISTYGDMINVPGTKMSLKDAQARGADIKTVYSADQVINDKERVFFAVGFETTTPMTARLLQNNITVFSAHKVMPPAMRLIADDMRIDGFIDPGHVSTIIGSDAWSNLNLNVPQVISGFKPDALIRAIYLLLRMIKNNEVRVINDYPEVVFPEGNPIAKKLIRRTMKACDSEWRGLGLIPKSGLVPKDEKLDARIIYKDVFKKVKTRENPGCRCGEVIKGLIEPNECKLFRKVCTPSSPKGACMVSEYEGACAIAYKYGKSLSE